MNLQATITAVHSPSFGWYQARTIFGETVSGVNLAGVGTETSPRVFTVGQKVSIWQVNGSFGAFGSGQSYLLVPDSHKSQVIQSAPTKCALFYLATLAGNTKVVYSTATVISVGSGVTVSGSVVGGGKTLPCNVPIGEVEEGHRMLVQHIGRSATILGWWQTVPSESFSGVTCCVVGRPPFRSFVDMRKIQWRGGSLDTIRENTFGPKDPISNIAWTSTKNCTEVQEYLYTHVIEAVNYGAVTARYYVKWHRVNFSVTEITQAEYDAQPSLPYSKTVDGKFWWFDRERGFCETSKTIAGERIAVMYIGPTSGTDQFFPTFNEIYTRIPT